MGASAGGRAEIALDDALYYLGRGCEPCAERQFDKARRHGATEEQVEAVRAAARSAAAGMARPTTASRPTTL
jgi:Carboxymuconolactone decarboxylase family